MISTHSSKRASLDIRPKLGAIRAVDRYGFAGALPSAVTDGGAALLALVLLGFFIKFRTPWAKHRSGIEKQSARARS